jgi:hypothetical protein
VDQFEQTLFEALLGVMDKVWKDLDIDATAANDSDHQDPAQAA